MTFASLTRAYVIAEAGVNHNGDRDLAFALVDAAARAGADAVKFQTFQADLLAAASAPKAAYQQIDAPASETQREMLRKLELPRAWHQPLQAHARALGLDFMSTAFDLGSLDFLLSLGVPMLKIPSGEVTNAPLVWRYGRAGPAIILSTGMATLSEVELALAVLAHAFTHAHEPASEADVWRAWGQPDARRLVTERVMLLHCTSRYPTALEEVNLRALSTLSAAFGAPVGYSDHTADTLIAPVAVACGARLIEKHFTLDRSLEGPDHKASLTPDQLAQMIAAIRAVESAMGDGRKAPAPSEWETRTVARQQVVAARPIAQGAIIQRADLTTARCGGGRAPVELWGLIGQPAARAYAQGEPV